MNKGLYFMTFTAGIVIGSIMTWRYLKKKYEQIAQEEIDSVKEVFAQKEAVRIGEKEISGLNDGIRMAADQAKEKPDISEYAAIIHKYAGGVSDEKGGDMKEKYPYVIRPEEFGEFEDYERISLTYYSDGILADENDEIVDDVDDIVGDALNHFGEYEEDSVFVRCDERRCDYEILLDRRTFTEVTGNMAGQVEV